MRGEERMSDDVRLVIRDGVALLTLDAPPVNALNADICDALARALDRIAGNLTVRAVVLLAQGRFFSAGVDLRDREAADYLARLCDRIDGFDRPVVAALQGLALGGGAELALAAHFRLALPEAGIGLPEVTLGLIPAAGGTQRLARLVGAQAALGLLLGARPLGAQAAQKIGLIDGVVQGDLPSAGLVYATGLIKAGQGPRPSAARRERLADGMGWMAAVTTRRQSLGQGPLASFAAARIVDCVEAALLLPAAAALTFERAAYEDCLAHPQSRALRHIYLAERQISPDLLAKTDGGRALTPAGQAVCDRLTAALHRAAQSMERIEVEPAQIDGALVAAGFVQGPFGGLVAEPDQPVLRRMLAALMAEGGRLVDYGTVARAADIDALAVHGMGFPRIAGGPMMAAQQMGLIGLRRDMQHWMADDRVWAPPALMSAAIKLAGGFEALSSPA